MGCNKLQLLLHFVYTVKDIYFDCVGFGIGSFSASMMIKSEIKSHKLSYMYIKLSFVNKFHNLRV